MTQPPFALYVIAHPSFAARFDYITGHIAAKSRASPVFTGIIGQDAVLQPGHGHSPALTPGEVGCALSHMAAYRHMAEHGIDRAFVIEDDVVLPDSFDDIARHVLSLLEPGEVISLHSPTAQKRLLSLHGAVDLAGSRLCHPFQPHAVRTASCYAIHIGAAVRIAAGNNPVRFAADDFSGFWENGLVGALRIASPQLAETAGLESVIGYHKPGLKKALARWANDQSVLSALLSARRKWLRRKGDRNHMFSPDISPLAAGNPAFGASVPPRSAPGG